MRWIAILLAGLAASAQADLRFHEIFKDNMVLQRDARVSVYGQAPPGCDLSVEFGDQSKSTRADGAGSWELKLDPMPTSFTPRTLRVVRTGSEDFIVVTNVVVGDVWLCGGQSNMALGFGHYSLLAEEAAGIHEPFVRSVIMKRREAGQPDEAMVTLPPYADAWRPARDPWVMPLSPTAYYFGAALRRELDVPVGLLVSAVGGSQIQRWMPGDVVADLDLDDESSDGAGSLYNAMLHSLRRFTIKGVIWYQGESNGRIPHSYEALSKAHIRSWRDIWARTNPHLGEMPFFTVQVAPFTTTVDGLSPDAWAYIRDAQRRTLDLPNTGLVVTTDLGERNDIHPQNKRPVGERLARWAMALEGRETEPSGPLFSKAMIEGDSMRVHFTGIGSGLETRRVAMSSQRGVWAADDPDAFVAPQNELAGFTVCGADRRFEPAEARIEGDTVVARSARVPAPVAVRYGWSTFPVCNLYNREGLPASPFRSDDFPVPDVQGRKIGEPWGGDEDRLGSRMEFTGSNPETRWRQVTVDGRKGVVPDDSTGDKPVYAYFRVADPALRAGAHPAGILSMVYFDNNTGALSLQYDSSDPEVTEVPEHPGAWKRAARIKLKNTGRWTTVDMPVPDAYFDGRCNGADIRVTGNAATPLGGVYYRSLEPAAGGRPDASMGPLNVYILAGQSNMEGHANVSVLDYIGEDPATAPLLAKIKNPDGTHRVIDGVWISYLTGLQGRIDQENREVFGPLTTGYGNQGGRDYEKPGQKIGPELAFGITMRERTGRPILLIKTAWGGQSLHTDFRSPSSGPYVPTEDDIRRERFTTDEQVTELEQKTGARYRQMIEHVKAVLADLPRVVPDYDPDQGYELAGFVWFQGFNDLVARNVYPEVPSDSPTPRFQNYTDWFANFIRDTRRDLSAPDLPFVIGVLGVGGKDANPGTLAFRKSQVAVAGIPELTGTVVAVSTAPYWDERLAVIDHKRGQIRQKRYHLTKGHRGHENADGDLSPEAIREILDRFEAELFTEEDYALERRGKSNAGYHYLGSAKTYSLIGQALAEALPAD